MPIAVIAISREPRLRQQVSRIIEGVSELRLLALWESDEAGDEQEKPLNPDVLVIDGTLSFERATISMRDLKRHYPWARSLIIGSECSENAVIDAVRIGLDGFLWLQDLTPDNLMRCVRGAYVGELALPRRVAGKLIPLVRQETLSTGMTGNAYGNNHNVDSLTPREVEVLRLVARGARNREIAAQLVVTPATVNKHIQNILNKLNVHNRVAALREVPEITREAL
jgi:DNA-binding NarL/FixJ family response regulator